MIPDLPLSQFYRKDFTLTLIIGGTILTGLIAAITVLAAAGIFVAAAPLIGVTAAISAPALLGSAFVLGTVLDFGLELTQWKYPVKGSVNKWWDANVDPVTSYAFNQPSPVPAQPPIPAPMPSTEMPISTPSPEQISPQEVLDTGDE